MTQEDHQLEKFDESWSNFRDESNASAFEALYTHGLTFLLRVLRPILFDDEEARDVTQTVFARLWVGRGQSLPPGANARQALLRWAFDELRNRRRRMGRKALRETS